MVTCDRKVMLIVDFVEQKNSVSVMEIQVSTSKFDDENDGYAFYTFLFNRKSFESVKASI